ncbi:MAG: hypothetical protein IKN14_04885 [Clostridiales bacterium]|nr:hypothetical protein [Clostridiales bacterium]
MSAERSMRSCHSCGASYHFYDSENIVLFCPVCGHSDHICCDFFFGPSSELKFDMGERNVGMMRYEESSGEVRYRLTSETLGIDRVFGPPFMQALHEAGTVIGDAIGRLTGQ